MFSSVSELSETRVITLGNNSIGNLYHLNFPLKPVAGLKFVQRFVAPPGYTIHIQFHHVVPSSCKYGLNCKQGGGGTAKMPSED